MADISKLNAVPLANIEKLDAVLAANIAKVNGLVFTTGPAVSAPAAAYSVRLLDSALGVPTYTGAAMRVRRETAGGTGDDDEADIAFDSGVISLDSAISNASAGVTATTLGQFLNVGTVNGTTYTNPDSLTVTASCFVDEWKDQSGNANHAEQTTPGSQPQIHSGTVNTDLILENGKPALYFNGAKALRTLTEETLTQPYTGSIVGNLGAQSSASFHDGYGSTNRAIITAQSGYSMYAGTFLNGTAQSGQLLSLAVYDGASSKLYANGNLEASGDAGSGSWNIATIGNRYTEGSQFEIDYMAELVIWGSDQTTNRTAIEENINSNYLIYQPTDAPTSGLLATYTGAAAAYSVRQLSDKAVIALRIRRDSDDEETNIGWDANGDLDTTAISNFCDTANGYVTRWWDQSTNGNHADQATDTAQPQIYNGTAVITENGKPCIDYDSTGGDSFDMVTSIEVVTSIHVLKGESGTGFQQYILGASAGLDWFSNSGQLVSQTSDAGQNTTLHLDGASVNPYIARPTTQSLAFFNWTTGSGTTNQITQDRGSSARSWKGTYQELILYTTDESSNRTGIETNINTYFSIY